MKQTTVETLIEQIKSKADSISFNTKENRRIKSIYVDCLLMARQAKEMEKQQIIDAMYVTQRTDFYVKYESSEHYYNETFKKK
jgi:hypothetical protein